MQKYANLVGLEKCCQTRIFMQNFVLIQPRTSPPKNVANNFDNFADFAAAPTTSGGVPTTCGTIGAGGTYAARASRRGLPLAVYGRQKSCFLPSSACDTNHDIEVQPRHH